MLFPADSAQNRKEKAPYYPDSLLNRTSAAGKHLSMSIGGRNGMIWMMASQSLRFGGALCVIRQCTSSSAFSRGLFSSCDLVAAQAAEGKGTAFLDKLLVSSLPTPTALHQIYILSQRGFGWSVVQTDEPQALGIHGL